MRDSHSNVTRDSHGKVTGCHGDVTQKNRDSRVGARASRTQQRAPDPIPIPVNSSLPPNVPRDATPATTETQPTHHTAPHPERGESQCLT